MEKSYTKVKDLSPESKQVNVLAKVVSLSEEKEIQPRFGEARKLVEATVGDETATVLLTLWENQIGMIAPDETIEVDNGYVTLVRGHVRLNVGKYGSISKSEQAIEDVNTELDVSEVEHQSESRYRGDRGGRGGDRGGRGDRGSRDDSRGFMFGGSEHGSGGRRDRGRRRP